MNTIRAYQNDKDGGVLLMAMLVLLAFSVLAVGMFRMSATSGVEAVYQDQSKEAFWSAESGLEDAVQRLRYDAAFRALVQSGSGSYTVSNAADRTHYDITVTDTFTGNATLDLYVYDVDSVGWKGSMNRRIRQRMTTQPGYISAIMSPGNINVDANTLITGPIMVLDNGEIILDDKIPPGQDLEGDYDIVILDDDASINDKKSGANEGSDYDVVDLPVPDDLPSMPDFSSYKATAETMPASILTNTTLPLLVLTGGTTYFNEPSGITINKITGSGTLVNTGHITINGDVNAPNDVSSDVAVLSFGNVIIGQKTDFDGNNLIYAFNSVDYGNESYMPGNSAILADGGTFGAGPVEDVDDITMGGQSQFYGIVFADEGNVNILAGSGGDNNTRIEGTVIGGGDVDVNSNTEIMFNPDVFYGGDLFDLEAFFNTEIITTKLDWEELPSL